MFKWLSKLFVREKWETVYFTQKADDYAMIKQRLADNHIAVKTKFTNSDARDLGGRTRGTTFGTASDYYEILVKAENVHEANHIIHHR